MKLFLRFIHKSFLLILIILVGCPTTEEIKLLNQGIKHFNKGQYDKAISDFTKSIEIHPSAEACYRRGDAYLDKAISAYYKVFLDFTNPSAEAYYRKVDAYLDKAISDFNKAIELNPNYAEAYHQRGVAYYRRGNAYVDKAISDFNKAIELNPKYAEAYCKRGDAYFGKSLSEFLKDFKKKKIDLKLAQALDTYAYTAKAISDFNKAIELNPEYVEAYQSRGWIYSLKDSQSDKAKADRNKVMAIFYWRAISYQLKSQYENACFHYRQACDLGYEAACDEIDMFEETGFFCQQTQSWILKIKSNRVIQ